MAFREEHVTLQLDVPLVLALNREIFTGKRKKLFEKYANNEIKLVSHNNKGQIA